MRPAFDSTSQAAAFGLLLLLLLAAPWLAGHDLLPQPNETYSSESIRWEKFPWTQKFIYEETNDIDIAFVGSSHICDGIDTTYVQQKLAESLGHKAVVRTIAWVYPGFDALYFFTRDLLSHRHVKTLVFYDECGGPVAYEAHPALPFWYRFGMEGGAVAGLPIKYRVIFYFGAVIGMPRNLVAAVSSSLPPESSDEMAGAFAYKHSPNPETRLGCISAHLGFDATYGEEANTNFVAYAPPTTVTPDDIVFFSPSAATNFIFSNRSLPASQVYFARQFGLLAKRSGCNLLELHLPGFAERNAMVITESRNWTDLMQTRVGMMGIPTDRLFAGLSEQKIELLFSDPGHLNANGQKYFTALITPGLIKYYENHAQH